MAESTPVLSNAQVAPEPTPRTKEMKKKVTQELAAWDLDGDGQLTEAELIAAGRQQLQLKQNVKNLKKTVAVVSAVSVAVLAAFLAVVIVGNEATKETHASSGALTDTTGRSVATTPATSSFSISSLGLASDAELQSLRTLNVENGSTTHFYKLAGFDRDISTGVVTFYTTRGHVVVIDSMFNSLTVFDSEGNELPVGVEDLSTSSRRLLQRGGGGGGGGRRFLTGGGIGSSRCNAHKGYNANGKAVCCRGDEITFMPDALGTAYTAGTKLYGCIPSVSAPMIHMSLSTDAEISFHMYVVSVLGTYGVPSSSAGVFANVILSGQGNVGMYHSFTVLSVAGPRNVATAALQLLAFLDVAGAKAAAEASDSPYVDVISTDDMNSFISGVSGSSSYVWAGFKAITADDVSDFIYMMLDEINRSVPRRGGPPSKFGKPSAPTFPLEFRTDVFTYKVVGYSIDRSAQIKAIISAKRSSARSDGLDSEEEDGNESEENVYPRLDGRFY
eukprot:CAMPEP_0113895718 /NCGR_PEP_ID=MMETSP0780_2-20120614/17546_1 /TAXON_ID=652834 /ORGANISM="Palpitomonas bilix" /LENGTH=501 /DNA_ID=CAMNT_0000886635 /DNA_START=1599 /DNA_END=3104 /DNA_ORIENTATION=+ /assembly_acc=CAM_ASM_000599